MKVIRAANFALYFKVYKYELEFVKLVTGPVD